MRTLLRASLLASILCLSYAGAIAQSDAQAIPPTEISADLGGCSALITVTDAAGKPVFNAKVTTRIHYGTLGLKKLDLEVYTSAAGQVKIQRLPEVPRKPVYFYVSKDEKLEIVDYTPDVHCRGTYDVKLK